MEVVSGDNWSYKTRCKKNVFFCAMFFVVVVLKRFLVAITANIQHVFWLFKWNWHARWSYKMSI